MVKITILDNSGNAVVKYEYDSWGNCKIVADEEHTTLANLNPIRYRGYFYDTETGLYYLKSRYYDPEVGRFISQDNVAYADPETINGLNLYAYCSNNPVMYIDPNGNAWWEFWKWDWKGIGEAIGRLVGGILLTVGGFALTAVAGVASLFSPAYTIGMQAGLTIGMYGVAMIGSVFDSSLKKHMDSINWNPFNNDADKVLQSNSISFFRGVPVIRTNLERSGTFGIIYLNGYAKVETVKHEFGHIPQLLLLGPVKFGLFIGIPSATKLGLQDDSLYYTQPWEASADFFGGTYHEPVTREHIKNSLIYLAYVCMFPFIF